MKILHTSDWHLRSCDLDEARECLDFLITEAEKQHVDVVVIAGDITDSRNVHLDSKVAALAISKIRCLSDIAPVMLCTGTPFHEGDISSKIAYFDGKNPIYTDGGRPVQKEIDGVLFSLVPQPTKKFIDQSRGIEETDNLVASNMNKVFVNLGGCRKQEHKSHVLVGHFTVRGAFISENQQMIGRDIEISQNQLEPAKADLVCLGHIHKKQKINNIFYAGSLYSLTAGELDKKGFWIHELGKKKCSSKFISTPYRPRIVIDVDFTQSGYIEQRLFDIIAEHKIPNRAKVHVRPKIWADEAVVCTDAAVRRAVLSVQSNITDVKLGIIRVPRQNVRSKRILEVKSLPDKLCEMATVKGEEVPPGVIDKAHQLETEQPGSILERVRQS